MFEQKWLKAGRKLTQSYDLFSILGSILIGMISRGCSELNAF